MDEDDPYAALGEPVETKPARDPFESIGRPAPKQRPKPKPKGATPSPVPPPAPPAPARPSAGRGDLSPSGFAYDGDTYRTAGGSNARMFGYDAPEREQPAFTSSGQPYPLGQDALNTFLTMARPSASVGDTGQQSYNRPVVTLKNGGGDVGEQMVGAGMGFPEPNFLASNPALRSQYMDAQRNAISSERGAYAGTYQLPRDFREQGEAAPYRGKIRMAPEEAAQWDAMMRDPRSSAEEVSAWLAQRGHKADNLPNLMSFLRMNPGAKASDFYQQIDAEGNPVARAQPFWTRQGAAFAEGIPDIAGVPGEFNKVMPGGLGLGPKALQGAWELANWKPPAPQVQKPEFTTKERTPQGRDDRPAPDEVGKFGDEEKPKVGFRFTAGQERQIERALRSLDARKTLQLMQEYSGATMDGETIASVQRSIAVLRKHPGAKFASGSPVSYSKSDAAAEAANAPKPETPALGGTEMLRGGMHSVGVGQLDDSYAPQSTGERYLHAVERSIPGAVAPMVGARALAGNLTKQAVVTSLTGSAGSYAGGVAADQVAPGNEIVSLAGQVIGGLAGGAGGFAATRKRPARVAPSERPSIAAERPAMPAAPRVPDRLEIGGAGAGEGVAPSRGAPIITAPPERPRVAPKTPEEVTAEVEAWARAKGVEVAADGARPEVMLHGSPRGNIDAFDPYGRGGYGLFGTGTYLTDNPGIAAAYTKKGAGKLGSEADRSVYAVRQNVKNPIDMDAPADVAAWESAAGDYAEFKPGMTNEQAFREVEEILSGEMFPAWEGAEIMSDVIRKLGHDGITHLGGGRVGNGPRHRVLIALDPEQTQIVDRMSVEDMVNPRQPRAPDWIDVAESEGAPGAGVYSPAPIGGRSAAMADGSATPSLAGPRVVDRIDVNDRPRPLLDPATAAERHAAAERIDPEDVLPVPSSQVGSVEEAAAIEKGRYARVKAPNENAELSRASLPAADDFSKRVTTRGPVDLVTWLRSQGGLKPQGGELDHFGITNAPRTSMDFTRGEGSLGKLIDPELGMTYDEAALRAWEAGYFPDHAGERPAISEFLDALNATHSGRNRSFLTEDLPEVDRFEGARSQRQAVEKGKQEGAPLVEDRGQEITLDDLEANAAPVRAYEEWGENAPDFAGNIRLENLDSPQNIKRALVQVERVNGGFDAARRGRITQAETEALAGDLNMTPAELLKRRKGQALNAEEALAARQILAKSGNELVNMAKRMKRKIDDGEASDADMATFRAAIVRHAAIQEQVSGATAEAGRTLAQFKMTANSRNVKGEVLRGLIDEGGGPEGIARAADVLIEAGPEPKKLNTAAKVLAKPTWKDKALELWYNFLLSGPRTHAVNITSNLLTSLGQIPEHLVASAYGAPRAVFRGRTADRVLFSETGASIAGYLQGAKEGLIAFGRAMKTGEPSDFASKVEAQTLRAIGGVKGTVLRTPTRLLMAEDEFFKGVARRTQIVRLAVRQAGTEGLHGKAAKARAADLAANPTPEMIDNAYDFGRYVTFQRPLGKGGQAVINMTAKMPVLKLFIPFVRTPLNLLKFAIERSPAAPALTEWRADVKAGGARRDLALARATVGTGVMMLAVQWAQQGLITGGGPADEGAKRMLLADGWQPYSVKIDDKYYSYQRLDPFSTTLGLSADFVDLQSHMTDKQKEDITGLLVASTMQNLSEKTWLSGMSNVAEALSDPGRYGEGFVARMAASIATPAIVAQTTQALDPVQREAQDWLSRIRSRVPGMSETLPPRRDVTGLPIEGGNGGGLAAFSPVYSTDRKNDPTLNALINLGINITKPAKQIGDPANLGKKIELTPQQYDNYQFMAGEILRPQLSDLIRSAEWRSMSQDERDTEVEKIVREARTEARSTVLMMMGQKPAAKAAPPWLAGAPDQFSLIGEPAPR